MTTAVQFIALMEVHNQFDFSSTVSSDDIPEIAQVGWWKTVCTQVKGNHRIEQVQFYSELKNNEKGKPTKWYCKVILKTESYSHYCERGLVLCRDQTCGCVDDKVYRRKCDLARANALGLEPPKLPTLWTRLWAWLTQWGKARPYQHATRAMPAQNRSEGNMKVVFSGLVGQSEVTLEFTGKSIAMMEIITAISEAGHEVADFNITSIIVTHPDPVPEFSLEDIQRCETRVVSKGEINLYEIADNNSRLVTLDHYWTVIITKKAAGFIIVTYFNENVSIAYYWNNELGWVKR